MKKIIYALIFSSLLHFLSFSLSAQQDAGFMYARITTFDDEVLEGQIRWGKEEALWTDMFNASKVNNDNIDYLTDTELKNLERSKYERNGRWKNTSWGNWNNNEPDFIHQFSCQFGEIKQIDLKRYKRIEVTMKDDTKVRISGDGYNDLDADIFVYNSEKGSVKLHWSDLLLVEFLPTPDGFKSQIGKPLYGTVKTRKGIFVGQVQWDKDERVTSDILDGNNRAGKHKIPFGDIKAIEKFGDGCDVEFKDGSDEYLEGSNDVDHGNRGVIVTNPAFGRVVVDWDDFRRVDFMEQPANEIWTYSDFQKPKPIQGTVTTKKGETIKGQIIYDLDEAYEYELLNGEKGRLKFEIPFRNIQRVIPGRHHSTIELKSSKDQIVLEDSQDINSNNEGILVFTQPDDPVYINWNEVKEIVLD